jgi:hypothetical protein
MYRTSTRAGALIALILLALPVLSGCGEKAFSPHDPDLVIDLRWIKSYPRENREAVDTGLYWALSFLGARLPADAGVLSWHGQLVSVDLDAAQVIESTRPAWKQYLRVLKSSDEYRRTGGVDIGRFVLLALCSPNQYYPLTGASASLQDFRATHATGVKHMAIVQSGVSHGNRLIDIGPGKDIKGMTFVAYEGSGSIQDHTFSPAEVETLEFMENGQLRFRLYDPQGRPMRGTDPELTAAGKPSKCLWCHEIRLQPPFRNVTNVDGYLSTGEFADVVKTSMQTVDEYRRNLKSKVLFSRLNDHSYAEYLYQAFAEPSARRLALEWNLPLEQVERLLHERKLSTHGDHELAGLGGDFAGENLYNRADVDALAPYPVIRAPSSSRESSSYEPDLLH